MRIAPVAKKILIITTFSIILSSGFTLSKGYAALTLNVEAITGGNSIRFGRIHQAEEVSQEVRIRISSFDNQQYHIFQRIVEPLQNENNVILDRDAIKVYTLVGSNSSGSLYLQNPEPISSGDQLIYTSSPNGQSDAVTIVYNIDQNRIRDGGHFSGKILFIARPVSGGAQENVYLNVSLDAESELEISVKGSTRSDLISINPDDELNSEGYAKISFKGNLGQDIRIYQELNGFIQDEISNEIDTELIHFNTTGSTAEYLQQASLTKLSPTKTLLYSSQQNQDDVVVNFVLNKDLLTDHKAGHYKGKLKYIVETNHLQKEFDIDLVVTIKPIFNLEVELPPEGVTFSNLLPLDPPQIKEVKVKVQTNLGKPYSVVQHISSPLVNEAGEPIPNEFFKMKGELVGKSLGRLVFSDFAAAPLNGESPVFFSDNKGSSAEFTVFYQLQPYPGIAAGDYSTAIVYSLAEI